MIQMLNVKHDFSFITLITREDLVFVDEVRSVNANAFDDGKLVTLVAAKCFCHECVALPVVETS